MASRRTKSIGTKVTPEEYARIQALAGEQPVSEWVRAALLKATDASPADSIVLAELLAHPQAAMCFHWQPLERQVRVEGVTTTVSDQEADEYFATRARGSQVGAWASQRWLHGRGS